MLKRSLVFLALLCCLVPAAYAADFRVIHSVKGTFDDVKQGLELAITGHGLVISHFSDVGGMLARTGEKVGASRTIYLHAGVFEFCSAVLSRKVMEADPANLVFCPYSIAFYVLPAEPDTVYVAYERLTHAAPSGSREPLAQVETLLERIVQEGMSF